MLLQKQIFLIALLFAWTGISRSQTVIHSDSTLLTGSIKDNCFSISHPPLLDSLVNFGKTFLHKPYNYRVNNQTRFDCSGFTSYVYDNFGYSLKRSSAEQAQQFDKITRDQLQTGDLVFFSGRRNNSKVGHVGIIVTVGENGKFDFIHSSNHSGIVISKSEEDYYAKRYIRAGRVVNDSTHLQFQESLANKVQEKAIDAENLTKLANNLSSPTLTQNHLVVKGDSLYAIARKYGISVNDLKKFNQLKGDKILPKQLLRITAQNNSVL